jgi:hypothetical protein
LIVRLTFRLLAEVRNASKHSSVTLRYLRADGKLDVSRVARFDASLPCPYATVRMFIHDSRLFAWGILIE